MPDRLHGTTRTDAALLAGGASDDFVEVCRRHGPALRSYLRRRTRDGDVVADLLAETFAAAWVKRGGFADRCDGSAAPWLFGIARNQVSMHVRRGVLGPAKDALRRPGTAFAVDRGDPTRDELILDPATGRLRGSRTTLTRPDPAYSGAPAGTVVG